MNEQDKILLSAYLDSDLDDSEKSYVENLLETNEFAKEYLEVLKSVNIENENYFKSSLKSSGYQEANLFV